MTPQNPIKLIATYSRVSTSLQEEQQTIKNQLNALQEYATKNSYTIVEEYVDDGWSGDILARPALDKLRQDAKNKVWEGVLIYDPDRLARRYSYQELLMDELREAGLEVMFITVSAPKNSEDKILHGVRGIFAEYERAKIAERFRLGKLRKLQEGHVLTTDAPYGYNYIPKRDGKHGYYEINPEESKVIKMIFEWVANEGVTIRTIVKKLAAMGIKPRKSLRGVWSTSTLSTLLRNPVFIGQAHWGSSYAVVPENPKNNEKYKRMKKSSRKRRPKEDWIIVPVPAIIDKDLFEKAGRQLDANYALCKRNRKNQYLLANKIYCTCGRHRHGEGSYNNRLHLYYRCDDRILNFPLPPTCKEKGINAAIADEKVWGKITEVMSSEELLTEQISRYLENKKEKGLTAVVDVEASKKEFEKLQTHLDRYNKGYGAGVFTLDELKEYTAPLKEKISRLETQIANAASQANQINMHPPTPAEIAAFADKAKKELANMSYEAKREIIVNFVDRIAGNRDELKVTGQFTLEPLTSISHVEFCSFHRHCGTAKCRQIHTIQRHHQKQG